MPPWTTVITARLQHVQHLRRTREGNPLLEAAARSVKQHQHARFARDYAPLLASARHGEAARFFLDQIYGPVDFTTRDAQFERVVPLMARVLPNEVLDTIADLIELHALTEDLDQQMAAALTRAEIDERSYRGAWLKVGRQTDRERQLELLLKAGNALDRYTRSATLRATLRLMRAPARAAGLGRL
ncbi:MAG TPA: hypothetical protein VFK10_12240, partial [Burkholderiaceae bacterium]|nr:hypothetical protein [Burkholderiaceae bacterium]